MRVTVYSHKYFSMTYSKRWVQRNAIHSAPGKETLVLYSHSTVISFTIHCQKLVITYRRDQGVGGGNRTQRISSKRNEKEAGQHQIKRRQALEMLEVGYIQVWLSFCGNIVWSKNCFLSFLCPSFFPSFLNFSYLLILVHLPICLSVYLSIYCLL